jgi:hypothetical protein
VIGDGTSATNLRVHGSSGDLTITDGSIIDTTRSTLYLAYATPKPINFNNGEETFSPTGAVSLSGSTAGLGLVDRGASSNTFTLYNASGLFRINDGADRLTIAQNTGNVNLTNGALQVSTTTASSYFLGNLGIGTTSPATTLSVSGNGYLTGGLGVGLLNTTAGTLQTIGNATIGGNLLIGNSTLSDGQLKFGASGYDTVTGGASTDLVLTVGGSNNALRVVNSNGFVGIGPGVTTAVTPLNVVNKTGSSGSTVTQVLSVTNSLTSGNPSAGYGAGIETLLRNNGGAVDKVASTLNTIYTSPTNGNESADFTINTIGNGTLNENLRVQGSTGNVGIGTTSPDALLTVGSATPSGNVAHFENSTGSCYINPTTTSLSCSSDQRLKTNIQSLNASSTLAGLLTLNPVTYNWKTEPTGTPPHTGFIAQQVLPIFPDLVSQGPDGYYTLNYAGFAPYIVEAMQQMYQQLTSLENTVASFAQSITSAVGNFGQVNTNDLCVGSTCVTPAQFQAMVAAANASQPSGQESASAPSSNTQATNTPPIIQINGANPAIVQVGATYNDLGATITGPQQDLNLGITTYVNGTEMSPVQIDTSTAATDTIDYVGTDQNGLTSTSTRTVIIEAPEQGSGSAATSTATTNATSTAQ